MAEAFLQVLLDNLTSLVKDEIGLIMGMEKEMNKLSSTLTTIQVVIEDAEDKQLTSKPIRNWLSKLKDLVYEIDDVLDECAIEVSKSKHKSSKLNSYRLKNILNRRKIGRRVKGLTDKLDAVAAERDKFHLREMVVERQSKVAMSRETSSVLNEPDLVYGRDEEMEKIVDILVNQVRASPQLSVMSILGIGGLGKTTLAQLVYNHPRVTKHFEKKVWICVSDNFDIKTLVKAIIDSATGSPSASDNLDALQRRLRELLNQKRYLLILDDVWNEKQEEWVVLKSILACGSSGASIIVTTRIRKVSDIMGTLLAHELSTLSEEHCWSLFKQCAFGQEIGKHPNLESLGKEIVKKCAGVPLAAKALGSFLRFERAEKEWVYVNESEIWNLPHEEALILPSLRLSYQHLPLQLRQCFAYCAIYSKDHEMEKQEVIYYWMAHGYISSKERKDVEDVGDDIWNQLVLRSLFQDVGRNYKGKIIFKMHDLVHDLARSIMENKVPRAEIQSNDRNAINRNKIRQVNVVEHYVAFPRSSQKEVNISYALKNFNCLRVLDASGTYTLDLPSKIHKLKHLRHLNLCNSLGLRALPNTVCSLWNLQLLNLNNCKNFVKLSKRMRYMKNLRHLFLDGCDSLSEMPPKIGELISLRTLSIFIVGRKRGNQLDELQYLNLGDKIEIKSLERVKNHLDAKKANMGNKSNLRDLALRWEGKNASEQQQEMDEKVLKALEPHQNLKFLEIYGFSGRCFPHWTRMENIIKIHIENFPNCLRLLPLGDLPRLKFLYLINLGELEYMMENEVKDAMLFPSLEKLELRSLPNLKGLLKHEDVVGQIFPNLQTLCIWEVIPLLKLPPLSSLKELRCSSLNLNPLFKLGDLISLSLDFENDMRTCVTNETLENLSNLKTLRLYKAKEHNLPIKEGLQGLKSLTKLEIYNCDTLMCLPYVWLRHLNSLETLIISKREELVEVMLPTEGMEYHLHSSLKHLQLCYFPKMVCLAEVMPHMIPSLQSLILSSLPQLTSLPDSLGDFTSLQHLNIWNCPRVASLPGSIQGMTNLKSLSIFGCPKLERRCEKQNGEDWHIIAHIPDLIIEIM